MNQTNLLSEEHLSWIGHEDAPIEIEVSRRDIIKYSMATEQKLQKYLDGDEAPLMFIFNLFAQPVPMDQLRVDGLARGNQKGPSLPLKRVMAGGKEVEVFRPIKPGDKLIGVNRIKNIYEKSGKQGPLIFTEREFEVKDQTGLPVFTETETSIAR